MSTTLAEEQYYSCLYFNNIGGELSKQIETVMRVFSVDKPTAFSYVRKIKSDCFNASKYFPKKIDLETGKSMIAEMEKVGFVKNVTMLMTVIPPYTPTFDEKTIDLSKCPTVAELRDILEGMCDEGRGSENIYDLLGKNFNPVAWA